MYEWNGAVFDLADENLQDILSKANFTRGRIKCRCKTPYPPMHSHIMPDGVSFSLRRNPNTGHLHYPFCRSYSPPPGVSGLANVLEKSIKLSDEKEGHFVLALGFSMSTGNQRQTPEGQAEPDSETVTVPPQRLRLLGLLHFLWEFSELTKWNPAWQDKRGWGVIRSRILSICSKTRSGRFGLEDRLFVPEQFILSRENEILSRRRAWMSNLAESASPNGTPLGIIVAEIKFAGPSIYGGSLVFKHIPEMKFDMDAQLYQRFTNVYENKKKLVDSESGARLVAVATFLPRGRFADIFEISMMPVTENWIPFDNQREAQLIESISGRKFVRPLRYNLGSTAGSQIPAALLADTQDPVALFVSPSGAPQETENKITDAMDRVIYPTWIWRGNVDVMPVLPRPA